MKTAEHEAKPHPSGLETELSKQDIIDRERAAGEGMFEGKEFPPIKPIKPNKKRSNDEF